MSKIAEETKPSTQIANFPKVGDIIESKVISKGKSSLFLDLENFKTAIIYGAEYNNSRNSIRNLKPGDTLLVKITDLENDDGYTEVSLNQAGEELTWDTLKKKKEEDEIIKVKIQKANKGGLLAEISGIQAFLPVSQLSSENYPRVEDGDSSKILKELQKFVGQEMEVKIFDISQKDEKLILSEKVKEAKKIKEILSNYSIGDVVQGEITAVLDFGAFIKFNKKGIESLEGLIHISELDWQLIENPSEIIKTGDKVEAKIIDISNDKVSLSLKALKQNPWEGIDKKYKTGDIIKGKVVKLNPFGLFAQISKDDSSSIQGLVHISEIGTKIQMTDKFQLGQEYDFEIIAIEQDKHKISLKPVEAKIKTKKAKTTEKEEEK